MVPKLQEYNRFVNESNDDFNTQSCIDFIIQDIQLAKENAVTIVEAFLLFLSLQLTRSNLDPNVYQNSILDDDDTLFSWMDKIKNLLTKNPQPNDSRYLSIFQFMSLTEFEFYLLKQPARLQLFVDVKLLDSVD